MRMRGLASFICSRDERRVERAESLERPERVEAGQQIRARRAICCSAGTTDLSCLSTSSCCAVSRHQPFGWPRCATSCAGVSFSMRGCVRVARACRRSVSRQMRPWRSTLSSLYCSILRAQVRAPAGPLRFLDDAAVHVDDVHRAVGRRRHVHRTEERIGGADELVPAIDVAAAASALRVTTGCSGARCGRPARRRSSRRRDRPAGDRRGRRRCRRAPVTRLSEPSGIAHRRHPALHVGDADRRAPRNRRSPGSNCRARRSCRRRSGTGNSRASRWRRPGTTSCRRRPASRPTARR